MRPRIELVDTSFECDQTIILTLARVCGGQMVNDRRLYYFNPSHEFLKLYRIEK